MLYKSTMEYFKPMMRGLRKRTILPDLLAGIWMIVKAIAERNYLQASSIYMSLSVGELVQEFILSPLGYFLLERFVEMSVKAIAAHLSAG